MCLLAHFCRLCRCRPGSERELVGKIRKTYENLNAFKGEFVKQVLSHRKAAQMKSRDGRLSFQKPLLIRWRTARPHEKHWLRPAREIWDYLPDEEIVYRYPASMAQGFQKHNPGHHRPGRADKRFQNQKSCSNENGLVKWRFIPRRLPLRWLKRNI